MGGKATLKARGTLSPKWLHAGQCFKNHVTFQVLVNENSPKFTIIVLQSKHRSLAFEFLTRVVKAPSWLLQLSAAF